MYLQQIRIMSRVEGREDFVLLEDGYYAITTILGRKRKRDGTVQCKVEWMGSLTTDWVPEDALCRDSCKLLFFFIFFNTYSTQVKLIIIVLYTDELAKTMYPDVVDDDETDNEELPEKVKSVVNVKTEEEDTDYETDNDQPSQVESNDKIKKENYGSYDDETDNEELPEKVKSNLDVKIEEEDTDNE